TVLRCQCGEIVQSVQALFQASLRIVEQFPGNDLDGPVHLGLLVWRITAPLGGAPVVESRLVIGIPSTMSDPTTHEASAAGNPVTGRLRSFPANFLNRGAQFRGDALVSVQNEEPIMAGQRIGV